MTTRMYHVVSRARSDFFFDFCTFFSQSNTTLVKPDVILDNKKIQANLDMTTFNQPQNHVIIIFHNISFWYNLSECLHFVLLKSKLLVIQSKV